MSRPSATVLMLYVLGCNGDKSDSDGRETGQSAETGDTGSSTEHGDQPWDVEGFWTDPGPLEPLFGATPDTSDTEMGYLVFMATSSDGVNWEGDPDPIMEGMNSLDLWVTDQGVILQGLLQVGRGVTLVPGTVYGIQSADLVTWGSHAWEVGGLSPDTMNVVDPSLQEDASGQAWLTYFLTYFGEGSPTRYEGPHEIWRARWADGAWTNEADLFEDTYLCDPVICRLDDQDWLFVTQEGARINVAEGDGDGTYTARSEMSWENHTVPYCVNEGDHLMMVSQGLGQEYTPRLGSFTSAGIEDLGELYPEHLWPYGNCTSPVIGYYKDQWISFCAVDWQAYLRLIGASG